MIVFDSNSNGDSPTLSPDRMWRRGRVSCWLMIYCFHASLHPSRMTHHILPGPLIGSIEQRPANTLHILAFPLCP